MSIVTDSVLRRSRQPVATAATARRVSRRRGYLGLALAVLTLAGTIVLSVAVGSAFLPLDVVLRAFTDPDGSVSHVTVSVARVDRTILGVLVGTALGAAGALIQALTRNPLADPGVLGVNAGAGFAVALAVTFLGVTRISQYLPFALAGAVIAVVVVYAIAGGGRNSPTPLRLTLVGVAFGAVLMGMTQALALVDTETFDRMRFWGAGTITDRPGGTIAAIAPFVLAGLLLALLCAHPLNQVALGDDSARAAGVRVGLLRVGVVLAVTLLCGAATAAAGPISFVGLMVPHAVRWFTGPDWRKVIVFSILVAPAFLLGADILGRLLVWPSELQVGVTTALVGAPVLVALVRRSKAKAL